MEPLSYKTEILAALLWDKYPNAFKTVDILNSTDEFTGYPVELFDEYDPDPEILAAAYEVLYNFKIKESTTLNPIQLNQNLTDTSELADRINSEKGIKEIVFRTVLEGQKFEFSAYNNSTIQNIGVAKSVGEEIIIATQLLENANDKNQSRLFLDNYTRLLHQLLEVDLNPVAADYIARKYIQEEIPIASIPNALILMNDRAYYMQNNPDIVLNGDEPQIFAQYYWHDDQDINVRLNNPLENEKTPILSVKLELPQNPPNKLAP